MTFRCLHAFMTLAGDEALVDFYRQLFQQSPQPHMPNRYAEFQLPGLKLAIFKPKVDHEAEFAEASNSPASLCLEVEDLADAIAHCKRLGASCSGPIMQASHGQETYAYDPAGNRLILHQS